MTAAAPTAALASTLVIPPRFCGPPGTGNGGYVAGSLAARTGARGSVEVTLRRPAPLATPLGVARAEASPPAWTLSAAEGIVAEARAVPDAPRPSPALRPAPGSLAPAGARRDHPFPHCFVCGPERAPGDGLRIAPVALSGADAVVAAAWTPPADLADARGDVAPAILWAALDCPGYFACMGAGPLRPLLLGRMTASLEAPVRALEPHAIVAWPLARAGRRYEAATALLDARGRVLVRSTQVWIAPASARTSRF
jgi:hypothetical protein